MAMTLPKGFSATLFAGEPDVVQPIAMTFDDRGRLWVVECLSYPRWRADGKGNDRVLIFEDSKNTGTFDKRTVFLDNGSNLSGITIGFGGVWLCSLPNLIFIPVKDGEDKPAGPPQVILDGWNLTETKHNVFNSLNWGPDGWLYGCNGIQAKSWVGAPGTPKEKRTYIDCGVWRYHPTKKVFEAFAYGTTNPFGLDWDDFGELFITNCVIDHLFHFVPGGHYQRMYGQDADPNVYELMGSCVKHRHWAGGDWTSTRSTGPGGKPEHSDAGGGHAHSGCLIYLGDNFPAEYRNNVFMCNIHGNRLNRDRLTRTPAGYLGVREPDFLFANDSWFRGIALAAGPDGALYVTDWCDTGECHNYDKVDASNGRIYKVIYGASKGFSGDVSRLSDSELVKLQLHPNDWFVRKARRVLQERAAAGKLDASALESLRAMLRNEKDVTRRLRALWALEATGSVRSEDWAPYLVDASDSLRAWLFRIALVDPARLSPSDSARLGQAIESERSEYVRVQIASALQRAVKLSPQVLPLVSKLLGNPAPATDHQLELALWYCLETSLGQDQTHSLDYLESLPTSLLRRNLVRYLLSQPQSPVSSVCESLVAAVHSSLAKAAGKPAQWHLDVLTGMNDSLVGKKDLTPPPLWAQTYRMLQEKSSPEVVHAAEAVGVAFRDQELIGRLLARISDAKADAHSRTRAIELLLPSRSRDLYAKLRVGLDDPAIRKTAIRSLAAFADPETPAAILARYAAFSPEDRADAVQTLAARASWAKALLDAVASGAVPRADVPTTTARQILAINDKGLSLQLEKVWGKVAPASKERAALMKKWKEFLTEETLARADPARGRAIFVKNCAACHKMYGEGNAVGPELTGSQRANLDYLLENVLDPSAVVPNEYRMINFVLKDDRVVSGIILRETRDALTVRTTNDTVVVPVADIASRKQTNLSIMPEGLLDQMKPDEVRDLTAYLRTKEQTPLPK